MSLWLRMHKFKESRFANDGGCAVCGGRPGSSLHRANAIPTTVATFGLVDSRSPEPHLDCIRCGHPRRAHHVAVPCGSCDCQLYEADPATDYDDDEVAS